MPNIELKILIVGRGVVGTIYGWALSEAGHDITHVVRFRDSARNATSLDLWDLRKGHSRHTITVYSPRTVTEISESEVFDVVIVATKHYQAAEAVAQYFPKAPSATFLLFTANWNGIDEIAGLLPRSSMQWGYAQATGGFDSRGALVATMNPEVRLGILDGGDSDKYKRVCELFESADFKLDIKQNIIQWLWIHHAVNAGGIGLCLWAGGIRKATRSPKMLILGMLAVQDALKVVRARGVDDSETRFATQRLNFQPLLAYLGLQFASRFTEKGRRLLGSGHFDNNPEEMKRYFNDVLTTGEQFGLDLPHLTVFRNGIDRPSGK